MTRTGAVLVAFLALGTSLAATVAAGSGSTELASPDRSVEVVAPTRATLACPTPMDGRDLTAFAVTPATGQSSGRGEGALAIRTVATRGGRGIATADRPGEALRTGGSASDGAATTVSAGGSLAPGASGAVWAAGTSRTASGLAIAGCAPAADTWLFNGVDTGVGSTARLLLTNPTSAVAVVDLNFFGPAGRVRAVGARGIALAPMSQQVLDLARFAPGRTELTVGVLASRGRTSAALFTSQKTGLTLTGSEWVPASTTPADTVVVGPGVGGRGEVSLVVTNPGDREALVQGRVFDSTGPFRPTELAEVRVPPASTVVVDLTTVTRSAAAAVELTGNVPVTAALVSRASGRPVDYAVAGVGPLLDAPAVVPVVDGAGLSVDLTTSVRGGTAVSVELFDRGGGSVLTRRVNVHSGATATWSPKATALATAAYVVVTPSAPAAVQGVATYAGEAGLSSLPVASSEWTLVRPAVLPAP